MLEEIQKSIALISVLILALKFVESTLSQYFVRSRSNQMPK